MSARPFSPAEYQLLCNHLADRPRDHLLLVLGCSTGFRISELLSLTVGQVWNCIDVAREVTVARKDLKGGRGVHRKGIRSRRVPLAETVRAAIHQHLGVIGTEDPSRAIFSTARSGGRGMAESQAYRILRGAAVACGMDAGRVSTHSLRKTFVTRIYEASGHDLVRTQRIVGHSSPLVTARYLDSDSGELDRLVLEAAA